MSQGCEPTSGLKLGGTSPVLLICLVAQLAGCAAPEPAGSGRPRDASAYPNFSQYTRRYPDTPPVLDAEGLRILAQPPQGGAVLLHCWASWSRRSREDLVAVAAEQEALERDGVRVVACNFDPPREWSTRILQILQAARAEFPCVVIREEERAGVREWLGEDWHYQLPAQFVLDAEGHVLDKSFGDKPIGMILSSARRNAGSSRGAREYVRSAPEPRPPPQSEPAPIRATTDTQKTSRASVPAPADQNIYAKLINVHTGEWEPIPTAARAAGSDQERMTEIADYLRSRLNAAAAARIAVLPVSRSFNNAPSPAESRMADDLGLALRRSGFADVALTANTEALIARAGISREAISNDPSITRGRLSVDHLILIRGEAGRTTREPRSLIAADDHAANPDADAAVYESRRSAAEP